MNREEEAVGDDREEWGHALCLELAPETHLLMRKVVP